MVTGKQKKRGGQGKKKKKHMITCSQKNKNCVPALKMKTAKELMYRSDQCQLDMTECWFLFCSCLIDHTKSKTSLRRRTHLGVVCKCVFVRARMCVCVRYHARACIVCVLVCMWMGGWMYGCVLACLCFSKCVRAH